MEEHNHYRKISFFITLIHIMLNQKRIKKKTQINDQVNNEWKTQLTKLD